MSLSANSFLFPVVVLRRCAAEGRCAPPLQKAAAQKAVARKAQKAAARKAQKSGARKAQKAFAKKAQKVGAMKEVWAITSEHDQSTAQRKARKAQKAFAKKAQKAGGTMLMSGVQTEGTSSTSRSGCTLMRDQRRRPNSNGQ
jgi:hypothetical protein